MEQTNNAKARYIPTRVAVCKRCEGKGVGGFGIELCIS